MKQFVDVICVHYKNGRVWPVCILWEDGMKYPIDEIRDVRPAASLVTQGPMLRPSGEILLLSEENATSLSWLPGLI